jgi:hypothetical protein
MPNHRKVLIADDGHGGITGVVTSAMPMMTAAIQCC